MSPDSWKEENFDVKKWFRSEPELTMKALLCYSLERIGTEGVLGFKTSAHCNDTTFVESDMEYVLEHWNLDKNSRAKAVKEYLDFFEFRKKVYEANDIKNLTTFKVRDLQDMFPQLDWLNMINSQLLTHNQVKEDDEISIENMQLLESLLIETGKLRKS